MNMKHSPYWSITISRKPFDPEGFCVAMVRDFGRAMDSFFRWEGEAPAGWHVALWTPDGDKLRQWVAGDPRNQTVPL